MAARKVTGKKKAAGVAGQSCEAFEEHLLVEIRQLNELTPRNRPGSIKSISAELTFVLRGWFGYFRHCRWTIFKDLDAKIRSRLRRLQLKRHRTNPERLPRTRRWPSDYFAKLGLYSLREAHFRFAQSVAGNCSLESRVRDNRPHGSEGGGAVLIQLSLPLSERLNDKSYQFFPWNKTP